jgi:hypothetical protein
MSLYQKQIDANRIAIVASLCNLSIKLEPGFLSDVFGKFATSLSENEQMEIDRALFFSMILTQSDDVSLISEAALVEQALKRRDLCVIFGDCNYSLRLETRTIPAWCAFWYNPRKQRWCIVNFAVRSRKLQVVTPEFFRIVIPSQKLLEAVKTSHSC